MSIPDYYNHEIKEPSRDEYRELRTDFFEHDEVYIYEHNDLFFSRKKLNSWVNVSMFCKLLPKEKGDKLIDSVIDLGGKAVLLKGKIVNYFAGYWCPLYAAKNLAKRFGIYDVLKPLLVFNRIAMVKYCGYTYFESFAILSTQRQIRILRWEHEEGTRINLLQLYNIQDLLRLLGKERQRISWITLTRKMKESTTPVYEVNDRTPCGGFWLDLQSAAYFAYQVDIWGYVSHILSFKHNPSCQTVKSGYTKIERKLLSRWKCYSKGHNKFYGFPMEFALDDATLSEMRNRKFKGPSNVTLSVLGHRFSDRSRDGYTKEVRHYTIYRRYSDGFVNGTVFINAAVDKSLSLLDNRQGVDPDMRIEAQIWYRDFFSKLKLNIITTNNKSLCGFWCSPQTLQTIILAQIGFKEKTILHDVVSNKHPFFQRFDETNDDSDSDEIEVLEDAPINNDNKGKIDQAKPSEKDSINYSDFILSSVVKEENEDKNYDTRTSGVKHEIEGFVIDDDDDDETQLSTKLMGVIVIDDEEDDDVYEVKAPSAGYAPSYYDIQYFYDYDQEDGGTDSVVWESKPDSRSNDADSIELASEIFLRPYQPPNSDFRSRYEESDRRTYCGVIPETAATYQSQNSGVYDDYSHQLYQENNFVYSERQKYNHGASFNRNNSYMGFSHRAKEVDDRHENWLNSSVNTDVENNLRQKSVNNISKLNSLQLEDIDLNTSSESETETVESTHSPFKKGAANFTLKPQLPHFDKQNGVSNCSLHFNDSNRPKTNTNIKRPFQEENQSAPWWRTTSQKLDSSNGFRKSSDIEVRPTIRSPAKIKLFAAANSSILNKNLIKTLPKNPAAIQRHVDKAEQLALLNSMNQQNRDIYVPPSRSNSKTSPSRAHKKSPSKPRPPRNSKMTNLLRRAGSGSQPTGRNLAAMSNMFASRIARSTSQVFENKQNVENPDPKNYTNYYYSSDENEDIDDLDQDVEKMKRLEHFTDPENAEMTSSNNAQFNDAESSEIKKYKMLAHLDTGIKHLEIMKLQALFPKNVQLPHTKMLLSFCLEKAKVSDYN